MWVKVPESRSQAAVIDVRNCCVSIPAVPDRKRGDRAPEKFSYRVSAVLLGFTGACVLIRSTFQDS